MLLLLLPLLVGGAIVVQASPRLSLLSPAFAPPCEALTMTVDGQPWLRVAAPALQRQPGGEYLAFNLTAGSTHTTQGADAVGSFTATTQSWSGQDGRGAIRVSTVIRCYGGLPVPAAASSSSCSSISFSQVFPNGAQFSGPGVAEATVGFPTFAVAAGAAAGIRRLTWSGEFSEASLTTSDRPLTGGVLERGPIALFSDPEGASRGSALVISPMNHFKKVALHSMERAPTPAPTLPGCKYVNNADKTSGHSFKQLPNRTRAECCAACFALPEQCQAFVRNTATATCYLLTGVTTNTTKRASEREIGFSHLPNAESQGWGYGITGYVREYPAGLNLTTLVTAAPVEAEQARSGGVHSALASWGELMRRVHGTQRESTSDLQLLKLGYYTDNGAWFNMNKRLNTTLNKPWVLPQTGLQSTARLLEAAAVPIAYIMLDDWWYDCDSCTPQPVCKCEAPSNNINCVDSWSARADWFPSGLAATVSRFNNSASLYQPTFCQGNFFNRTLGVPFTAPYAGGSQCEPLGYNSSLRTYRAMMTKHAEQISNFEIDFLSTNTYIPEFLSSLTANEEWLRGMHDAAAERRIGVQYCMALPSDLLTSLSFDWVTNARASGDYAGTRGWNLLLSSMLFWPLGLAPFKDTTWTNPVQPNAPRGFDWVHDQIMLDVLASVLSRGPVGISDGPGLTNATLARSVVSKGGQLLQPSKPLTAVEMTLGAAWKTVGVGADGYLGQTHTDVYNIVSSGSDATAAAVKAVATAVYYALAVNTTEGSASRVQLAELWPRPQSPGGGRWIAWDIGSGFCGAQPQATPMLLRDGGGSMQLPLERAILNGCATVIMDSTRAQPVPLSTEHPSTNRDNRPTIDRSTVVPMLNLSTGVARGEQGLCDTGIGWGPSCRLVQITPVDSQGFGLLGELGSKLLPVSEYRIANASSRDGDGGGNGGSGGDSSSGGGGGGGGSNSTLEVHIRGEAGEVVILAALVPSCSGGGEEIVWHNVTVGVGGAATVFFTQCVDS